MNGFILIEFVAIFFTALLTYQSIRYKVFYVKPFVGIGMFIVFGLITFGLIAGEGTSGVLGAAQVPALLISSLGVLIGVGWIAEGLDKLSHVKEGKK